MNTSKITNENINEIFFDDEAMNPHAPQPEPEELEREDHFRDFFDDEAMNPHAPQPEDDDLRSCSDEDHFRDDVEADADALHSAGWGEDESYGYFGGGDE